MSISKFIQSLMSSLPAGEWPQTITALRSDATIWKSLHDESIVEFFLSTPRKEIGDWSPAGLALSLLKCNTPLVALTASPLQPMETGLRIQAVRAFETLSHQYPTEDQSTGEGAPSAVVPLPDFALSGLLALALRERLRLTGSWHKLGAELKSRCNELVPFWETPLAILYGLVPDPLELLKNLVSPDTSQDEWHLGIHALLCNYHPSHGQLDHLQALAESHPGCTFTAEQWMKIVRQVAETHPDVAEGFMKWLIDQGRMGSSSQNSDNLDACERAIMLAEANLLAGLEQQALEHVQHARLLNLHVQAELDTSWAYITNLQRRTCETEEIPSTDLTKALRKSVSTLSEGEASPSLLNETQNILSEVLLDAGDASETAKWMQDLAGDNFESSLGKSDAACSPAVYLQAARLAQQSGEQATSAKLLSKALERFEAESNGEPIKSLQHRLLPQAKRIDNGLAELVEMAMENHLYPLAAKAARHAISRQPYTTEKLLLFGQALFDPKSPSESCQVYEMAVGLSPDHLEARRQLAYTLESMQDWDVSLPHRTYITSRLQETGQANTKDLYALGKCAYHAKQYHAALKAALQAIEIDPEETDAQLLLARTQASLEDFPNAIDTYRKVTQLSPGSSQAWLGISEVQARLGQSQQALETLRAAAQAVPDSIEVNLQLGELLFNERAYSSAVVSLNKAHELARSSMECQSHANPLYFRAAYLYGQSLLELGEIEHAGEVAEEAYHHSETPEDLEAAIAYQYARTLLNLGNIHLAIEPLETALQHGMNDDTVHLEYARALLTLKIKPVEAVRAIQNVLQVKPGNAEAMGWLAVGLQASGDVQQAFATYHQALETELVKDSQWHSRLSFGLGSTADLLGKQDLALAALQEAVQIDPGNIDYLRKLTEVYWGAGLDVHALETARTALYLDQNNPEVIAWYSDQILHTLQRPDQEPASIFNLGRKKVSDPVVSLAAIEAQAGNPETVNLLRHAISIVPDRTDLYTRLARHELLAGNLSQANEALQKLIAFGSLPLATLQEGAKLAQEAGNNKMSADYYRRAAQVAQESDAKQFNEMLLKLAGVQAAAQNYHAALQTVQQLLTQAGSDIRPYILQAEIYQTLEQPDSVTSSLENAIPNITQPEDQVKLVQVLINTLINQGKLIDAFHHAVKVCEIIDTLQPSASTPSSELFILAAYLANSQLFFDQARSYLDKWQSLEQSNKIPANRDLYIAGLHLNAELALEAGDVAMAAACLDAYSYNATHHFHHLALQSRLQVHLKDHERAISVLIEAQKISPQTAASTSRAETRERIVPLSSLNPAIFIAGALVSISNAEAECFAWDKALEYGRKAVEIFPNSPWITYNLACLLVRRAEHQHLCADARMVTHSPGAASVSQEAQAEFTMHIQVIEKLLRNASQVLEEKGHSLPGSNELAHWKSRGAIAFQPSEGNLAAPAPQLPPVIAPWILSAEDYAAWIAHLRRSASVFPDVQTEILPAAVSSALQQHPHHPLVLLQSAQVLLDSDSDRAQEILQSAEDRFSGCHPFLKLFAQIILAHYYTTIGKLESASLLLKKPLETWPDEPHLHTMTASLQWAQTDQADEEVLEDCFSHLEESIRLDPMNLQPYLNLGEMVLTSANFNLVLASKSIRLIERATRLFPLESELWLLLAQLLYRSGRAEDLENAGRCAEQAILSANAKGTASPDIKPHLLRAEIALQQGQPELALKFIDNAQELEPASTDALLAQVRALEALSQPADALQVLDKIISQSQGDCLPLALRRAELLAHSGDLTTAQAQLQKLAEENVTHPEIFAQLAKTLFQAENGEGALQAARNALQLSGATPDSSTLSTYAQSEMHHLIGTVLSQTGQLDAAISHLGQAIRLTPSVIDSHLALAQVFQKQRQHTKAQQVLEQAISTAPHDHRPFYQAGLALKDSKDYLKSEAFLRRAVELAPDNVTIRRQLAAVVALNLVHNPRSVLIR